MGIQDKNHAEAQRMFVKIVYSIAIVKFRLWLFFMSHGLTRMKHGWCLVRALNPGAIRWVRWGRRDFWGKSSRMVWFWANWFSGWFDFIFGWRNCYRADSVIARSGAKTQFLWPVNKRSPRVQVRAGSRWRVMCNLIRSIWMINEIFVLWIADLNVDT